MRVTESKAQNEKKLQRICSKCKAKKAIDEYYVNRDWKDQAGHDIWCKECVQKMSSKNDVLEYFWENNREWNERIWQNAETKALRTANDNATYQKANEQQQKRILERLTVRNIPSCMTALYRYSDNSQDGAIANFEEAKQRGMIVTDLDDDDIKRWNDEWNGTFNRKELNYLENYYSNLESDHDFTDETNRDYGRKISRASLLANKTMDDYAAGRCDYSAVKDAMNVFDMLNKSANLAACRRKIDDSGTINSFSELTYFLETNGYPCVRKIEWEQDDVDRTIQEFMHLTQALGLDNA